MTPKPMNVPMLPLSSAKQVMNGVPPIG